MGLSNRIDWPGFQTLTADRVEKGFTVIQIVAGFYPIAGSYPNGPPFAKHCENEGGWVWESNYARINPAYFDYADLRIKHLVDSELVPCIFSSWGFFLPWTGVEKMKKHWRNIIARWGAYPVVWCLAGESTARYNNDQPYEYQLHWWTEIGKYVSAIDPYHHPVSIHPSCPPMRSRLCVDDKAVLDFEMLLTGHADWETAIESVDVMSTAYSETPPLPVLNAEVCYEGHMMRNFHPLQRHLFWAHILNGACGHTYGAGGIWEMNGINEHYGSCEDIPWTEAMHLPGSKQLGINTKLLMRYPWWRFEPHPDWVDLHTAVFDEHMPPYAAGIEGEVRFIYIPLRVFGVCLNSAPLIKDLENDVTYRAFYFNPVNGKEYDLGIVKPDKSSSWQPPPTPLAQDWILVLEKVM